MIEIKKINIKELKELQKISKSTFFETFAKDNSIDDTNNYILKNFSNEQMTKELSNPNSCFYFCIFDSKVAGYLKLNRSNAQTESLLPEALEIERIYILNQFQGFGLGKILMSQAIEEAKQAEIDVLWLGVWEHNLSALQFYKKLGFVQFSQHTFQLGDDKQLDLLLKLSI